MSHDDEPLADDFPGLVRRWERQPGSKGGWWALAGFSFQAAVYLETFFRGLRANVVEPANLAEFERLSDIFALDNGYYRLIQVKRTLELDDLKSALREAYRIARNCDPELLKKLRFQIACLKRITRANPSDILHTEVPRLTAEVDLWQRTLAQFDPNDPIVVMPDPIDRLHYLLWECGVRSTLSFLDECRGILVGAFDSPDSSGIADLARRLARLFHQTVEADKSAPRLGRLLCREDLAAGQDAASDHAVVFQSVPSNEDLRLGRFRLRDAIFDKLIAQFDDWWASVRSDSKAQHLPIFWIDGRSAEGKSLNP